MKYFLIILCLALPLSARAEGPILVDTGGTGGAVVWRDGAVRINLESGTGGGLGLLTNAEATDLVRELFGDWQEVTIGGAPTVSLTLQEGTSLGSVDASNMNSHFTYCPPGSSCPTESPPFVTGSARSGQSPILFDDDGSMTDAVQGAGASRSILGFAGPRVVERSDGVLSITEGQAILNGRFIDGVSSSSDPEVTIEQFKGAIFHEIGHFIGIDHTQVNIDSVVKYLSGDQSESYAIPTMLPLFIDGEAQLSAHFDDQVAVSALYPSNNFSSTTCRMEGTAFQSDGVTELQGVNVIASNTADPLREATSFVSGSFYTGLSNDCTALFGDFTISGLLPGSSYTLSIEPISASFKGGSSIEPCDPPQAGYSKSTLPGTFSCSAAGQVITEGTDATTQIVTTKAATTTDTPPPDDTSSSGGGCSLIPEKSPPAGI